MNNVMILESPVRKRLKKALIVLILLCIVATSLALLFSSANKANFNGRTKEISGTVISAKYDEDDMTLTVNFASEQAVFDASALFEEPDWNNLQGKNVTFSTPLNQFGNSSPIILGITANSEVIVDTTETIRLNREEGETFVTAFAIIAATLAVCSCAAAVWRINVRPAKEYSLAEVYAKFFSNYFSLFRPHGKKFVILYWVELAVFLAVAITGAFLPDGTNDSVYIVLIVLLAVLAIVMVASIVLGGKIQLKERAKFFAKNFPFAFTDTDKMCIPKKQKQQIALEFGKYRLFNPYSHPDGGNDCEVEFGETGVILDFGVPQNQQKQNPFEQLEHLQKNVSYEDLNLVALPFYFKNAPLMVVVKSQLASLYELGLENDVHLILDADLLSTITHWNVPVENLQHILQNKEKLIEQHLLKKH